MNYLAGFGDEDAPFRFKLAAQLYFGKAREHIQFGQVEIVNVFDHTSDSKTKDACPKSGTGILISLPNVFACLVDQDDTGVNRTMNAYHADELDIRRV